MRRLLVVATSVVVFAAGAAFAGEVKGPPGTPNNTNETGALDHANSACAASGLNDLDQEEGQTGVAGSDRGGLLEVLRASKGLPRHTRTLQGRNGATLVGDKISWLALCSVGANPILTDTAALPWDRLS